MSEVEVLVRRLPHGEGLPMPVYASELAAGADLVAAVEAEVVLGPGERRAVPTGLAIALPVGYEAQVRPRSGLAVKHGVTVLNTPGTIDADYRGELQVLLVNLGSDSFEIARGMRVAQLVVAPIARVRLSQVATLARTLRGTGGFGSTGS